MTPPDLVRCLMCHKTLWRRDVDGRYTAVTACFEYGFPIHIDGTQIPLISTCQGPCAERFLAKIEGVIRRTQPTPEGVQ